MKQRWIVSGDYLTIRFSNRRVKFLTKNLNRLASKSEKKVQLDFVAEKKIGTRISQQSHSPPMGENFIT